MKVNIKTKSAIFPMPVLLIATYNDDNSVNVMNAAWAMMIDTDIIALNLSANHKTVANIKKRKAFTVSIADSNHVIEADYFGIETGNKVNDKLAKANMTSYKSSIIDTPIINELKLSMECEFIEYQENEYGIGVVGKIVNVLADEQIVKNGVVDVTLLDAIAYDPFSHSYYSIDKKVGNGFKDGRKLIKK